MSDIILAIDQGTTGSTAAFFEAATLRLLATAKVEFPQIYPSPGLVEHAPESIWASVVQALSQSWKAVQRQHPGAALKDVLAIGVTNQRETVVAWDRQSGESAGNAIVWQDRRTADFCESLKQNPAQRQEILDRTGLVCDPYFSASKMRWMRAHYPKVAQFERRGTLVFGTIDSYLLFRLTGGAVCLTEDSNASRTMLYNLGRGRYDPTLCSLFGIDVRFLPEIVPSTHRFGVTKGVPGLPDGIPITGCVGDQQAALLGHGETAAGEGKITYGTGTFLLVNSGTSPVVPPAGLLSTVALCTPRERTFALEGSAFIAGAAIQFLRDNFAWFSNAADSETLAARDPRDPHLAFIPALAGLGAPYWNPHAKGALFGLTRGSSRSQITRAVLESIAFQNVQILSLMERALGRKITRLGIDGGASRNELLIQFQADITRVCLQRPESIETAAKGAARAALLGLDPPRVVTVAEKITEFAPRLELFEAEQLVQRWSRAAECVNSFYGSEVD